MLYEMFFNGRSQYFLLHSFCDLCNIWKRYDNMCFTDVAISSLKRTCVLTLVASLNVAAGKPVLYLNAISLSPGLSRASSPK